MPDTFTPEQLAQAAALTSSEDNGKRKSNASPYLRTFVESGDLFAICDMSLFPDFTKKDMIQNFKNAAKVTYHNAAEDRPEYDIPGAYHVQYTITGDELYLINKPLVDAAMAAQAAEVAAAKNAAK